MDLIRWEISRGVAIRDDARRDASACGLPSSGPLVSGTAERARDAIQPSSPLASTHSPCCLASTHSPCCPITIGQQLPSRTHIHRDYAYALSCRSSSESPRGSQLLNCPGIASSYVPLQYAQFLRPVAVCFISCSHSLLSIGQSPLHR